MTDVNVDDVLAENAMLRERVASLDADIIGCHTIIALLQQKLRVAEDEASAKKAAARQAETVTAQYGLLTTVIPTPAPEPAHPPRVDGDGMPE